jgi:hypothetical protein
MLTVTGLGVRLPSHQQGIAMKQLQKTPNQELYDLAIDAHFANKITTEEFFCYDEAYGPDWKGISEATIELDREYRRQRLPRWLRWFYRWCCRWNYRW